MRHTVWSRRKMTVNTDPQRRCYNGCHYSSKEVWGPWESLGQSPDLKFWTDLNDYAVRARGPSAKCEFKLLPEGELP